MSHIPLDSVNWKELNIIVEGTKKHGGEDYSIHLAGCGVLPKSVPESWNHLVLAPIYYLTRNMMHVDIMGKYLFKKWLIGSAG